MKHHPHISSLVDLYQAESQPFRKVHRMIDLFETIIKSHTVVIMGEYFAYNRLSDSAKGLLAQGLRTPSLGTWQLFSRVLFEELQKEGYTWNFPAFPGEFAELDKALNADKTNVIAFRNGYAHGATPSDAQCETDIKKFEPFLQKLLNSQWLDITRLEHTENKVWIVSDEQRVCLHPILLYKEDGDSSPYAFFNDLKNDKVGLLNYPLSKHYREKELYKEFHEYLPLNEWKKTGNNEFYQRIEELTETFKGRTMEREMLLQFVLNRQKGYFSIQGNPGIGKSALIAQFFKDLKAHKETGNILVVEYFIRRGTAQAQVEYLFNYIIKKTDEIFPAGKEVRAEGKAIWDLQQQLFSKWRMWGERSNGKKLLFLIDGLDEGVENNVVTYLPRENFEQVLIIYGSRPGGHKTIDDLWTQLPVEYHTKLELSGLSVEDIRALIYEVANKYEIDRESAWIDAVQKRSQGNPLYLKLLCDAIEHGSIALNDINALPERIDEYYKAILDRYANDAVDGDALLKGLYAFAAAKDYLTMSHLGLINQLGEASVQRIGSTLKEVLYENPLTEEVLDYQLFHESFREYLVKEKSGQLNDAAERIIDFCAGWKELEGSWEQRYALEHYAKHLSESRKAQRHQQLMQLLYDHLYAATQKKVLRGFDASNELYRLSLLKSSELDRFDDMLESALCLVDLKYEEANDAPKIVEMVANGEIELALKRIESFGGADKEGITRKFILYMLCLMDLTLLGSKDKPFRKSAIERILNHLDEQIPVDTSLINWNYFFPSYLMFLMACEWAEIELNYFIVYKRTDDWRTEWIEEKWPFNNLQFGVLLQICNENKLCRGSSSAYKIISIKLVKEGQVKLSLEFANTIRDVSVKFSALKEITEELAKQGDFEIFELIAQEAISICDEKNKSSILSLISTVQREIGNFEASEILIQQSLEFARNLTKIMFKITELSNISNELSKQGKIEDSTIIMREALECFKELNVGVIKSSTLQSLVPILAKQGNFNEAIELTKEEKEKKFKCIALKNISIELFNKSKFQEASSFIQQALECAREIRDNRTKTRIILEISNAFAKQEQVQDAISLLYEVVEYVSKISKEENKRDKLSYICQEFCKHGKIEVVASILQDSLNVLSGIKIELDKIMHLDVISSGINKIGKINEAILVLELACSISQDIDNDYTQSKAFNKICDKLIKLEKLDSALEIARRIVNKNNKIKALCFVSTKLNQQHRKEEAFLLLQEAIEYANTINEDWDKGSALAFISKEMIKQGDIDAAINISYGLSHNLSRIRALAFIATSLVKKGKIQEAKSLIQEVLECAQGISNQLEKSWALESISCELARQGKIEESLECGRGINNQSEKSRALEFISCELARQGKIEEASSVMQEAIECAQGMSIGWDKSRVLESIACKLAKQGKWQLAEKIGVEILGIADRQKCWENMAKAIKENEGWQSALQKYNLLQNEEARLFYLKGWAENVQTNEVNNICLKESLPLLAVDSDSIEMLLQVYSLHELFFSKPSKEFIARLNRTLNIQWALDIVAQFPKDENIKRLSTNLDEWLHEISDEDDREEIKLLAKKVAKGKMTEEEFGERVRGMG